MPITIINHLVNCDQCRAEVTDTVAVDDRNLCASCAEEYRTCDHCGDRTSRTRETASENHVCDYCARMNYYECGVCEYLVESITTTASGVEVCDDCADNDYWPCEGCEELIDCGTRCESCADEAAHQIHGYSYKPTPEFHGTGPLYLGLELELTAPYCEVEDCAELALDHLGGLGYLKEDGSICGGGFEVVTHPMSYTWAMNRFPWDMLTELRDIRCNGMGNGLHVHLSRAGFSSPAHIYRWMKFLYRNSDAVITLARRESQEWAAFNASARRAVKDYAKGAHGSRYQAINTQNEDTFELRVFASSLDRQEVQAALALAAASVEYTRTLTVSDIVTHDGWEWSAFAQWLDDHPAYAPLSREMEELSCAC